MTERWRGALDVFLGAIRRRMAQGHRDYGDRSFHKHPFELLDEVQQELFDVSGWSFILWHRLQGLRTALTSLNCPHCGHNIVEALHASNGATHVPVPDATKGDIII